MPIKFLMPFKPKFSDYMTIKTEKNPDITFSFFIRRMKKKK